MRISTNSLVLKGLNGMLQQQSQLARVQEQIASGHRIVRPSDDPTGMAQILRLNQAISVTHQYQRNADNAANRLTLEESTLSSVQNSLFRIRELAIQGSNSTLSVSDRTSIAVEVRERLNELLGSANVRDANQDYLFSGYKSTTKPFSQAASGTFIYNGDQGQRSLQISSERTIADSDSGHDVFVNIKNGNGKFQINMKPPNIVYPGSYTAAVSDGNNAITTENTLTTIAGTEGAGGASGTENTVTAIAGTDGGGGGEQFILTIDGLGAVDVTYGAGETVATGAIAAELDSDLTTFIAGSGGAYSLVSGSLSGGDLVLAKADGTAITFDTSTSTLTGVAASVTESETTAGIPGEQFILTIDGLGAVDVTYGAGETVATGAIAAELDSDLATFIAGSGGAYSLVSGSLSGGDLVLAKADGTAITFDTSTSTLTGVAASVTESETAAGIPAAAPTDTAFTMSIDGTQFFTEAAAIGGTVTAAELDTALATFVAGSGGAYTSTGTIAAGTLVLTRADGSNVALMIDSNFSGTVGAFSGPLTSGTNAGSGVFDIGSVFDSPAYVEDDYTISYVTNGNGDLAYNVVGAISGQLIPPLPQDLVSDAPDHVTGAAIQFNGIQTAVNGTPVAGDVYTVTPSTKQDMFSSVKKLVTALEGGVTGQLGDSAMFNQINQSLSEIDIAFENVSDVRAKIGARLKAVEEQTNMNSNFKLEMQSTLSAVKDLDITAAIVELQSRTTSLEAAQASYARIQNLSLFNFL